MSEREYKQLINYLEEMISEGVQLIHAGNLLDWYDTKIIKLVEKLKKKECFKVPALNPGDQLKHKISKQDMWVINVDRGIVFLNPGEATIKYPVSEILNDFVIVKKASGTDS